MATRSADFQDESHYGVLVMGPAARRRRSGIEASFGCGRCLRCGWNLGLVICDTDEFTHGNFAVAS